MDIAGRPEYDNLTVTTRSNGSKFNFSGDTPAGEMAASHQRLLNRQQVTFNDILPLLVNDFEPLVFGHYPQLYDSRKALIAAGAKAAPMTGSGPTLVGLFESESQARAAYDELCFRNEATCLLAHTLDTTDLLVCNEEVG